MNKIVNVSAKIFLLKLFARHEKWEMQFWQLCRNKFAKNWIFFRSKPKRSIIMYTFQQNDFSSNMFVDTKNALLTIPSLNFLLRSYFSSPQNAKKMNNFAFFSEKRLFLGAFAGQGKSSFDSYAGINSLNSGIISAQSLYRSTKFQIFR